MRVAVAMAAATLVLCAPAVAAPNRALTLDKDHQSWGWNSDPGTGLLLDGTVADHAPCTAVAQTCDFTLVRVAGDEPGSLQLAVSANDQTLVDVDVYLYASDASGTQGDAIASSKAFSATEVIGSDVDPGYYLLKVAYMSGYGAYNGLATFTPLPPEDVQAQ
jgi:hypothetical protein